MDVASHGWAIYVAVERVRSLWRRAFGDPAGLGRVYAVASLIHFAHNAEHLSAYPDLPGWLTRYEVYGAWLCIVAIGALGYALHHRGKTLLGLLLIGVYAAIVLDGLLHYGRAP